MSAPLCFVDIESDGVHPHRKPWEIALIRRDEHDEHELLFFVEIDLSTADLFGLKVGRFYDRHPIGKAISKPGHPDPGEWAGIGATRFGTYVTLETAAQVVARATHGAHLVGAVPNFDAEVFDQLLRGHGLVPSWHYHLIDVEALAVGYIRGKHLQEDQVPGAVTPPWSSDELSKQLGVDPPGEGQRHTALGDARWARAIYDAVMGGLA